MSFIDDEELDSQDQPTEEVVNTEEVEEAVVETPTEDKPEYTETEKKLYARVKKAEAEVKSLKATVKVEPSQKQDGLNSMDTIALINAKVTEKEDIDEVMDYAKLKGLSIADALKANVVKTILAEKLEQRTTASATNTGNARRGSTKPTSEQILANAAEGKLPTDAEALAEARMEAKLNRNKK